MNNLLRALIVLVTINIVVTAWATNREFTIAVGEEECQVLGTNFVRSFLKDIK
jgi:hypothetical protein